MKIEERIARRQQTEQGPRLVLDYDALSPVAHPDEPVGRGSLIERLLDALEPVFDGHAPEDLYLWGPKGAGKSAVIRALFTQLARLVGRAHRQIYTTTRASSTHGVEFVYIDARKAKTDFALLHAVLDNLVSESIPKQGVSASTITERLTQRITPTNRHVVVAVDHVNEPETLSINAVFEQFSPFSSSMACVLIGRDRPPETILADLETVQTVHVAPYRQHALVEVLTSRVADGMSRSATTHEQLRQLAGWADGDAHDALTALFGAGVTAEQHDHETLTPEDMAAGTEAVPQPGISLARVLALPMSRQQILRRLIKLSEAERNSVGAAADAITGHDVGLSRATIERVLYELAEAGIVRRVKTAQPTGTGRPPSRLELRFSPLVFERLASSR